jgi:hypothetical protein
MPESVEDKCRKRLAQLFNDPPRTGWLPNSNNGDGTYISGRPDGEVRVCGGLVIDIECKGDSGKLYLGDPLQPTLSESTALGRSYDASGWHTHQRHWHRDFGQPLGQPYYIAALVAAERTWKRFDFAAASLFLVPPEAWLELERKVFPRKTVSLSPQLERILANKSTTLDVVWAQYRIPYAGQQYVIPETHPIFALLQGQSHG